MTNEERDLIARFIARVGGAPQSQGGFSAAPGQAPQLPPIDRDADMFIAEQFTTHPEARYRITQMAFVQEVALAEAASRIKQLEANLQQAQAQMQQAQQAQQSAPAEPSRGFLGGIFGGSQRAATPPPPSQSPWGQAGAPQPQYAQQPQPQYAPAPAPQYPPQYQPGMLQRSGSGFLGSALTTAAGVAGGMVAGNALMNLFSGNHGGGLFGGGATTNAGFGGLPGGGETINETTVINNYGAPDNPGGAVDPGQGGPWGGGKDFSTPPGQFDQPASDPYSQGGWSKDTPTSDPGYDRQVSYDPQPDSGGSWDTSDSGGSFDDQV